MSQRLAAVYAQVPAIECRGACADTCTSFPAPRVEKRVLRKATGVDLGSTQADPRRTVCPLLSEFGQCSVYAIRPLICRLWGVSALFPCNYGCVPTGGRLLGIKDTYRLIADVYEISGQTSFATAMRQILALPQERIDAMQPTLKAMAWGRIDVQEANRRVGRRLRG